MAKKNKFSSAAIVCVLVLAAAAVSKEAVLHWFGIQMIKEPIELQQPFDDLSETALLPYKVVRKDVIGRETLESLGTESYIKWTLEDTDVPMDSPVRSCSLFLTYYTGNPDMVPHVPDECYVGAGTTRKGAQTLSLDIEGTRDNTIGFQYVVFERAAQSLFQSDLEFSVQYLFHVNGRYTADRTQTRLALGSNWFCKYSYFCKVEWSFSGNTAYPDKEQTLQASKKLLERVLPELEKNHWPDWEKAKNESSKK